MSESSLLFISLAAIFGLFGTVIYIFQSIFKYSRLKMEAKNKALNPVLLDELKHLRSFKERTEKRLQALEYIASIDNEEESTLFLDYNEPPLESIREEKKTNQLKNKLK